MPIQQAAKRFALRALLPYGVDPDVIVQSLADKALSMRIPVIVNTFVFIPD